MTFIVVGAGVFGLSTAYHLLLDGETSVNVIDKSDVFPVPDGSSTDINRIVRSSYGDPIYTRLCLEAIEKWKSDFPGIYRESGVLNLGETGYAASAQINDIAAGARVIPLSGPDTVVRQFPSGVVVGSIRDNTGYLNQSCGWADAAQGVAVLKAKVESLGGYVQGGKRISSLALDGNREVIGVMLESGETMLADTVIIATGSWTPSIFASVAEHGITDRLQATGQSIITIKLTEEEYDIYKGVPTVIDWVSGFYAFPPNDDRILKVAIHDGGVTPTSQSDGPRTTSSHQKDGLRIPKDSLIKLKDHLRSLYPDLAGHPIASTRLCWYCDTADSDWLIDFHPMYKNVVFATGGSGHAYKFLPVLGRLVVQRLKGTMDDAVGAKFSFNRPLTAQSDPDRIDRKTRTLREEDLVGAGPWLS